MHAGSWESRGEAFEWHEAKPSASQASRVLSQIPEYLSVCAVINRQIDLADDRRQRDESPFVSVTSRRLIVPKLLSNKRPGTGEAVQELGKPRG